MTCLKKSVVAALFVACLSLFIVAESSAQFVHHPAGTATASPLLRSNDGMHLIGDFPGLRLCESMDGGETWYTINDRFQSVERNYIRDVKAYSGYLDILAVLFNNPDQLYLSSDAGQTWVLTEFSIDENADASIITFDPTDANHLFLAGDSILFATEDFGVSWTEYPIQFGTGSYHSMTYDPVHDQLFLTSFFYAEEYPYDELEGGLIFCEEGNYSTWTQAIRFDELWGFSVVNVADFLELSNGDWFVPLANASFGENYSSDLYVRSTDRGETWILYEDRIPHRFAPRSVVENPDAPGILYLTGYNRHGLYRSTDYGYSWDRFMNGLPENTLWSNKIEINQETGDILVSTEGYGSFYSEDNGASWSEISSPSIGSVGGGENATGALTVFEDYVHKNVFESRSYMLSSPADPWEELFIPLCEDSLLRWMPVYYHEGNELVSGVRKSDYREDEWQFEFAYSHDNGDSWEFGPASEYMPDLYSPELAVTRINNDSTRMIVIPGESTIALSYNVGRDWILKDTPLAHYEFYQDSGSISIFGNDSLYTSNDEGNTWELDAVCENPRYYIRGFLNKLDGKEYFTGSGIAASSNLFVAEDGVVRILRETDGPVYNLAIIPRMDDTLFVYRSYDNRDELNLSSDFGETWIIQEISIPNQEESNSIIQLQYDPWRQVLWATTSAGMCYLPVDQLSAVGDDPLVFQPSGYDLLNAYPNPMNSSTRIQYTLQSPGTVRLELFDIQGRLVNTVFDGSAEAGVHGISLEMSQYASGTYFLRMNTMQQTETQKLILLR